MSLTVCPTFRYSFRMINMTARRSYITVNKAKFGSKGPLDALIDGPLRRNSRYIAAIFAAGIVTEAVFDTVCDGYWESANYGVRVLHRLRVLCWTPCARAVHMVAGASRSAVCARGRGLFPLQLTFSLCPLPD